MKASSTRGISALWALGGGAAALYIQPTADGVSLAMNAFQYDTPNITNAVFLGGYASAGVYYDGPPGILESGSILTTGFATGANPGQSKGVNHGTGSLGLCGDVLGQDEASLTFDFSSSPSFGAYSFNFMFATENYKGNPAAMAVWLDGKKISVDAQGKGINAQSAYFSDENVVLSPDSGTDYAASTAPLSIGFEVINPGSVHTLQVAVCDIGNPTKDSAVLFNIVPCYFTMCSPGLSPPPSWSPDFGVNFVDDESEGDFEAQLAAVAETSDSSEDPFLAIFETSSPISPLETSSTSVVEASTPVSVVESSTSSESIAETSTSALLVEETTSSFDSTSTAQPVSESSAASSVLPLILSSTEPVVEAGNTETSAASVSAPVKAFNAIAGVNTTEAVVSTTASEIPATSADPSITIAAGEPEWVRPETLGSTPSASVAVLNTSTPALSTPSPAIAAIIPPVFFNTSSGIETSRTPLDQEVAQNTPSSDPVSSALAVPDVTSASATPTPPTPAIRLNAATVGIYVFSGCLGSSDGFSTFSQVGRDPQMSISRCISLAPGRNYVGVFEDACYAADTIGDAQVGEERLCSLPCPGDASAFCGGRSLATKRKRMARTANRRRALPAGELLSVYRLPNIGSQSSNAGNTGNGHAGNLVPVTENVPGVNPGPTIAGKPLDHVSGDIKPADGSRVLDAVNPGVDVKPAGEAGPLGNLKPLGSAKFIDGALPIGQASPVGGILHPNQPAVTKAHKGPTAVATEAAVVTTIRYVTVDPVHRKKLITTEFCTTLHHQKCDSCKDPHIPKVEMATVTVGCDHCGKHGENYAVVTCPAAAVATPDPHSHKGGDPADAHIKALDDAHSNAHANAPANNQANSQHYPQADPHADPQAIAQASAQANAHAEANAGSSAEGAGTKGVASNDNNNNKLNEALSTHNNPSSSNNNNNINNIHAPGASASNSASSANNAQGPQGGPGSPINQPQTGNKASAQDSASKPASPSVLSPPPHATGQGVRPQTTGLAVVSGGRGRPDTLCVSLLVALGTLAIFL